MNDDNLDEIENEEVGCDEGYTAQHNKTKKRLRSRVHTDNDSDNIEDEEDDDNDEEDDDNDEEDDDDDEEEEEEEE